MRFNPSDLIAFACVARTGSLTGASRILCKTQPAVSAQIKNLASVAGLPLLTRHRHGVTLTSAGQSLLPYAQAIARALESAEQSAIRLRDMEGGTLSVIASTSVAVYLLPAALAQFHSRYPNLELRLARHNADEAMHLLARGEGDLAVVRGSSGILPSTFVANFVTRTLMNDETLLVVLRDHRLARRKEIAIEELDGLEIVDRESTSATHALIRRVAARARVSFQMKFQTVGVEALKEAVLQGFGAGFLSRLAVQREIDAGILVGIRIRGDKLVQRVTLAYPRSGQCSPAVLGFVGILDKLNLK